MKRTSVTKAKLESGALSATDLGKLGRPCGAASRRTFHQTPLNESVLRRHLFGDWAKSTTRPR